DEHWLVRIIELVLDVPRMPATRHYREVRCQGSGPGGTSTGSTFPGCQPLGITGRYGVKGVAWEGRALARPRHRAGARRSQETRHSRRARRSALPGSAVLMEWPGGGRAPARPLPNTPQPTQLVKLNSSPSTPAL